MEIEVGEYVRNEIGQIAKVIGKSEEIDIGWFMFKNNPNIWYKPNRRLTTAKIIKHSKNLIDLIEERRLRKWNIGNRKRKHVIIYRIKRNR